jgi:hypothetical protein
VATARSLISMRDLDQDKRFLSPRIGCFVRWKCAACCVKRCWKIW